MRPVVLLYVMGNVLISRGLWSRLTMSWMVFSNILQNPHSSLHNERKLKTAFVLKQHEYEMHKLL